MVSFGIYPDIEATHTQMRKLGTVLLVDDDPAALYITRRVIMRQGIAERILTARNGLEAIQLIRSACAEPNRADLYPRLILVDVRMPVMDGFEFAEAMAALALPVRPVVALLTSSQSSRDLKRVGKLRLDGYLSKPLRAQSLLGFLDDAFPEYVH